MQRVILIEGAVSKDFGDTIADRINKILANSPDFKMTQVIPLKQTDCTCQLFCVFERDNEADNKKTVL